VRGSVCNGAQRNATQSIPPLVCVYWRLCNAIALRNAFRRRATELLDTSKGPCRCIVACNACNAVQCRPDRVGAMCNECNEAISFTRLAPPKAGVCALVDLQRKCSTRNAFRAVLGIPLQSLYWRTAQRNAIHPPPGVQNAQAQVDRRDRERHNPCARRHFRWLAHIAVSLHKRASITAVLRHCTH
jgi:hypothetical protein